MRPFSPRLVLPLPLLGLWERDCEISFLKTSFLELGRHISDMILRNEVSLLAILGLWAARVVAQDVNTLPACGQTCVRNMLTIASAQFGCGIDDKNCICNAANFQFGVRDCANQACGADGAVVAQYGEQYCAAVSASPTTSLPSSSPAVPSSLALDTISGTPSPSPSLSEAPSTAPSSSASPSAEANSSTPPTSSPSSNPSPSPTDEARTSPSTSPSSSASPTPSSGLTTTAQIAIGVGIPAGIFLIAAFLGAFILGRRRERRRTIETRIAQGAPPVESYGLRYDETGRYSYGYGGEGFHGVDGFHGWPGEQEWEEKRGSGGTGESWRGGGGSAGSEGVGRERGRGMI